MSPELSIVTGARNRPAELRRLIDSIIENTTPSWELIVADASDSPIELELHKNVVVIPERPRLGMAHGYNVAFKQCRGEFVIWLNDDCTVEPGYADAAIRFMRENPEVGLGCLYYSDKLCRRSWHLNKCCYDMLYANFGILRTEFGNQIGWFDADLCPMYGSDNTLAYRTLLAGKRIAGIPDARIVHHSDMDIERHLNNNNREQDSYSLKAKYGPLLAQMRAVYNGEPVPA